MTFNLLSTLSFIMNRFFSLSSFLLLFLSVGVLNAQRVEVKTSRDFINQSLKYSADKNYDAALLELNQVYANDSNYTVALIEKTLILIKQEQYDKCIEICKEGISKNSEYGPKFYNNWGHALDKQGKKEEGLKLFDEAILKYPMYYLLYYNKANSLENLNRYEEAIQYYIKAIRLYPSHVSSHIRLGTLAAKSGHMAEALLAINTAILINPDSEKANYVLSYINDYIAAKANKEELYTFDYTGELFSEVEVILQNRLALQKKYKVVPSIELPYIKQNHVLLQQLTLDPASDNFFMQTYVPIYKEIWDKGYFEAFIYYTLRASRNEKHMSDVKKNESKINVFENWLKQYWQDHMQVINYDLGEGIRKYSFFNADDGSIKFIGQLNATGEKLVGPTLFLYPNGLTRSKGLNSAEGDRTGIWYWYHPNGKTDEVVTYVNGEIEGEVIVYYENGNIKQKKHYEKGKLKGDYYEYLENNALYAVTPYAEGAANGPCVIYHTIGTKKYDYTQKDGKINGILKEYSLDEKLLVESNYVESVLEGPYKTYYRNGQMRIDAVNKKGEYEGSWTKYFSNGQISEIGQSINGTAKGERKGYYRDGVLEEQTQFDESGKLTGNKKFYDVDGKLHYELTYKKGSLIGYKYYDKTGAVISENTVQKGILEHTGYYPDKIIMVVGKYKDKDKEGEWKYYDQIGKLSEMETFSGGQMDGPNINYYPNGNVKSELFYSEGLAEGKYISYYPDKTKSYEGDYINDKAVGIHFDYYTNGKIRNKFFYVNGNKEGPQYKYSMSGKLENIEFYAEKQYDHSEKYDTSGNKVKMESLTFGTGTNVFYYEKNKGKRGSVPYKYGLEHGKSEWFYFDGKKELVGSYFSGEKNGEWLWYYNDGKLDTKGTYDMGDRVGKWTSFYKNGKPKKANNYYLDKYDGLQIYYHDNGEISSNRNYKFGSAEGEFIEYSEDGKIIYIRYYHSDKLIGYAYESAPGQVVKMIPTTGEDKITAYFSNGKKSIEYTIKNGQFNGSFMEYHTNGTIAEEVNYLDNEIDGKYTVYYNDGKVKKYFNYKRGDLEGDFAEYHINGKIKIKGFCTDDSYHGTVEEYSELGKLIKRQEYYYGELLEEKLFN
ncbi:MAG: hypothetical protein JWM14_3167 [Chitinophagaceae bacterium]|nr:hypothetical protein [Chitinophagaceae bacterium]